MRRSRGYRSPIKIKLKKKTLQTVAGLMLIAFAGISLLALFGSDTGFAAILKQKEFEYFGWGSIFLPIAAALIGVVFLKISLPFNSSNTAFGFFIFLVSVTAFTATFLPKESGLIGKTIADTLSGLVTSLGAAFLLFILSLIALVVTLNTSLETAFGALGKGASLSFGAAKTLAGKNKKDKDQNLGYISIPKDLLIKQEDIERTNNKNLTLIVAGSQGQPGSALNRIANGDHRFIFIKPGDEVVFSADPIPGNQDAVYEMIDNLSRMGANVKYSDITSDFHVSGHAAQDELILMLSITKPKYVVPISAMHRMMKQYGVLAESTGVPKQNIFIVDEAGIIEFDEKGARVNGEIHTENIFVDGIGVGDVGEVVLRDRKVLAEEGIVVVILTIDKAHNQIIGEPDIVSRGFVYMKESEPLIKQATEVIKKSLNGDKKIKNWLSVREKVTNDLERFLYQKTQRKPMVVPVIVGV